MNSLQSHPKTILWDWELIQRSNWVEVWKNIETWETDVIDLSGQDE